MKEMSSNKNMIVISSDEDEEDVPKPRKDQSTGQSQDYIRNTKVHKQTPPKKIWSSENLQNTTPAIAVSQQVCSKYSLHQSKTTGSTFPYDIRKKIESVKNKLKLPSIDNATPKRALLNPTPIANAVIITPTSPFEKTSKKLTNNNTKCKLNNNLSQGISFNSYKSSDVSYKLTPTNEKMIPQNNRCQNTVESDEADCIILSESENDSVNTGQKPCLYTKPKITDSKIRLENVVSKLCKHSTGKQSIVKVQSTSLHFGNTPEKISNSTSKNEKKNVSVLFGASRSCGTISPKDASPQQIKSRNRTIKPPSDHVTPVKSTHDTICANVLKTFSLGSDLAKVTSEEAVCKSTSQSAPVCSPRKETLLSSSKSEGKQNLLDAIKTTPLNITLKEPTVNIVKVEIPASTKSVPSNMVKVITIHEDSPRDGKNMALYKNQSKEIKIKMLEKRLEDMENQIKRFAEHELTANEMDHEESAYIQECKLKEQFIRLWRRYCNLVGDDADYYISSRKKIRINVTPFPELNREVERFVNRSGTFPNLFEIKMVCKQANEKYQLQIKDIDIHSCAIDLFTEVGKKMQDRRKKDFRKTMFVTEEVSNDPAIKDEILLRKLKSNRKIGNKNMDNMFADFSRQQTVQETFHETDMSDEDSNEEMQLESLRKNNLIENQRLKRKLVNQNAKGGVVSTKKAKRCDNTTVINVTLSSSPTINVQQPRKKIDCHVMVNSGSPKPPAISKTNFNNSSSSMSSISTTTKLKTFSQETSNKKLLHSSHTISKKPSSHQSPFKSPSTNRSLFQTGSPAPKTMTKTMISSEAQKFKGFSSRISPVKIPLFSNAETQRPFDNSPKSKSMNKQVLGSLRKSELSNSNYVSILSRFQNSVNNTVTSINHKSRGTEASHKKENVCRDISSQDQRVKDPVDVITID